ncbi:MAG: hypothetical protein ACUVRC_07065 [Desulfotomaculales bacterium]
MVVAAPVLGALAVRWRISDLGAGKRPAAGRVAWVAEGKLWVKDLPDGKARQLAAGEDISRPAWSRTAGTYFSYGWTVRTAPVCAGAWFPACPTTLRSGATDGSKHSFAKRIQSIPAPDGGA